MESHRFHVGNDIFDVGRDVARLDARTSNDGFRALHAWNHESQEFTNDIVPVLMIDFRSELMRRSRSRKGVLAGQPLRSS